MPRSDEPPTDVPSPEDPSPEGPCPHGQPVDVPGQGIPAVDPDLDPGVDPVAIGGWRGRVGVDLGEQRRLVVHVVRWVVLGSLVGVLAGLSSAIFLVTLNWATDLRTDHAWLIALLPLGGLAVGAGLGGAPCAKAALASPRPSSARPAKAPARRNKLAVLDGAKISLLQSCRMRSPPSRRGRDHG